MLRLTHPKQRQWSGKMQFPKTAGGYFLAIFLTATLSSCHLAQKTGGVSRNAGKALGLRLKLDHFTIQVEVAPDANQGNPIPADFVAVMDKKLIREISKLSAKDWFERRIQIQRDFPGKVTAASWEWVPGQHGGPISIELSRDFEAAYLFANYLNPGDHRAFIDVRTPVVVNFGPDEFSLQPLK
jgi:type VI secretion system protein